MDAGETTLTSDWYWGPYKVLCQDMGRKLDTYKMLDENNKYNLPDLKAKVNEILGKQKSLLLMINTPAHNPTGYSLSEEDLQGVIDIIKEATAGAKSKASDTASGMQHIIDYAAKKKKFVRSSKSFLICLLTFSVLWHTVCLKALHFMVSAPAL